MCGAVGEVCAGLQTLFLGLTPAGQIILIAIGVTSVVTIIIVGYKTFKCAWKWLHKEAPINETQLI